MFSPYILDRVQISLPALLMFGFNTKGGRPPFNIPKRGHDGEMDMNQDQCYGFAARCCSDAPCSFLIPSRCTFFQMCFAGAIIVETSPMAMSEFVTTPAANLGALRCRQDLVESHRYLANTLLCSVYSVAATPNMPLDFAPQMEVESEPNAANNLVGATTKAHEGLDKLPRKVKYRRESAHLPLARPRPEATVQRFLA